MKAKILLLLSIFLLSMHNAKAMTLELEYSDNVADANHCGDWNAYHIYKMKDLRRADRERGHDEFRFRMTTENQNKVIEKIATEVWPGDWGTLVEMTDDRAVARTKLIESFWLEQYAGEYELPCRSIGIVYKLGLALDEDRGLLIPRRGVYGRYYYYTFSEGGDITYNVVVDNKKKRLHILVIW